MEKELHLELHERKTSTETFVTGIDFLGWVYFPTHRVLRTVTKRRMYKRIIETEGKTEVVQSYLGLLSHGDAYGLKKRIRNL